jgi:enoyl-CoA hydratase/carnithine racemase
MMTDSQSKVTINKQVPGYWRVALENPPINTVDDHMYDEIFDLVEAMGAEPTLKVVTFESTNTDFFLAHYGLGESTSRFGIPRWIDAAIGLARSNVLSIAVVRGRARGGGCEFALACDLRFASRETAIFGQPEVGLGLIPGGGALERLPLLVGRARAIEIVLGANDFDADTAERYGFINRAIPDAELDDFIADLVRRVRSFDGKALAAAKQILNQTFLPNEDQLASTQTTFGATIGWTGAERLIPKARELGLGTLSDFELELGKRVADL